jgi:cell division protein FtsI/penicillin-binding protein 2
MYYQGRLLKHSSRGSESYTVGACQNFGGRLSILKFIALLWAFVLIGRLYVLQIGNDGKWLNWASRQHKSQITLAGERGPIYDMKGRLMAVSVPVYSVFLRPQQVKDKDKSIELLAKVLELDIDFVKSRFESDQPFVWIKRQIPKVIADRVTALNISGTGNVEEAKRYYPFNNSASSLLGRVGIDGNGLSGIEGLHEKDLNPSQRQITVFKDAYGNVIQQHDLGSESEIKGKPLNLTLDLTLQQIVDEEIDKTLLENNAKAVMAVMINAKTGDVLAMSQAPSLNPNKDIITSRKDLINLVAEASFEPGSTFKPIVAAIAIESGKTRADEVYDTEKGRFRIGKHTVKDVHGGGLMTLKEVVVHSSNVGMSKVGLKLGKENLYKGLKLFGFGAKTNLQLPGEASGILRKQEGWATIDIATHAFGQGVAISPLQLSRAFAALVNGGYLPELKVVKSEQSEISKPVQLISLETSEILKDMLIAVVEDEQGTGGFAKVPGVVIGGKTGTAQEAKEDGRGYQSGAYLASFIGFADGSKIGVPDPLVLLVSVDEPRGKSIYGGSVAAPAFSRIMKRSMHYLEMGHLTPAP